MSYLAVIDEQTVSIYPYKSLKEKEEILSFSSDCVSKSFSYKQEAIKWANANRGLSKEILVFEESEEHPFMQAMNRFRQNGYSGVRLSSAVHSGPDHIEFWLDDFWYYNRNYYIEWICKGWKRELSICISEDFNKPYIPFSKLKESFDANYEKFRGSCEEVFPREEVLEKTLSKICDYDEPHKYKTSPFERSEGAGLEMFGDFVFIHNGYRSFSFNEKKRKPLIEEYGKQEDILINTAQIISVEPFSCEYRITDPDFINVVEKIKKRN